jgi:predicted unusual protein kinase regulating ubiquinone biosynthesis (AarF/ABC1/UbiB family)
VDQFSKIMLQQLDLRREANSLVRLHRNFACA